MYVPKKKISTYQVTCLMYKRAVITVILMAGAGKRFGRVDFNVPTVPETRVKDNRNLVPFHLLSLPVLVHIHTLPTDEQEVCLSRDSNTRQRLLTTWFPSSNERMIFVTIQRKEPDVEALGPSKSKMTLSLLFREPMSETSSGGHPGNEAGSASTFLMFITTSCI
jgi:hypothetical protein